MTSTFDSRILNLVIFSPLLVAALVAFLPKTEKAQIRGVTLFGMLLNTLLCGWATWRVVDAIAQAAQPGGMPAFEFMLEYRLKWVDSIGLSYHVGVDGLAATLVMLTGVLGPLVVLASWTFVQERVKEFHLALLVLQTAMLGALCSLDTLLFFIFFEAMLIPMYLMIGVWGSEERQMAAMKFFLYTMVGSVLLMVAMLGVYFIAAPAGARSFDYATMYNGLMHANREVAQCTAAGSCSALQGAAAAVYTWGPWMFLAFSVAFAIKVPMFPVHTWLPDAHVQAPVAGSMILAGVMLKMGTFGFWRFAVPLFPVAARQYQVPIALLAVIGIVYGALMSLAQRDIKKLIAYSSVSHLGYCMLGMFALTAEGATGSAYQMLNHGVSTGALFLLFGFLYERRHARLMSDYGGIAKVMPVYTAFFVIVTFSSIAVPGTNGFVGEFLVLLGSFKSNLPMWFSVASTTAVILGAGYMLLMVQKVFFGQLTHPENLSLKDLNGRELLAAIPLLLLIGLMGLKPQPILDLLNASTSRYVARAAYASGAANANDEDQQVRVLVRELPVQPAVAAADERPELSPPPAVAQLRAHGIPGALMRPVAPSPTR